MPDAALPSGVGPADLLDAGAGRRLGLGEPDQHHGLAGAAAGHGVDGPHGRARRRRDGDALRSGRQEHQDGVSIVSEPSGTCPVIIAGSCPRRGVVSRFGRRAVRVKMPTGRGLVDEDDGVAELALGTSVPAEVNTRSPSVQSKPANSVVGTSGRAPRSAGARRPGGPCPGSGALREAALDRRRAPDGARCPSASAGMTPDDQPGPPPLPRRRSRRGRWRAACAASPHRRTLASPSTMAALHWSGRLVHLELHATRHGRWAAAGLPSMVAATSRSTATTPVSCSGRPARCSAAVLARPRRPRHPPRPMASDGGRDAGARCQPATADDPAAAGDHGVRVDVDVGRPLGIRAVAQQGAQLVLERVGAHRTPPSMPVSWVRRVASPREAADFTEPTEMLSASAVACSDRSA